MFTPNTPHTGHGITRSQRAAVTRTTAMKVAAATVTLGLGAGLSLVAPLSASADTTPRSYAQGRFLSGTVLGTNLDGLAALEATIAKNNGSQATQVNRDPLGVSALGTTVIHQPSGLQLDLGDIIDLGAVDQYARAGADGSSAAASGAISDDGGVGVGAVGSRPLGSATVDLDPLLGTRFAKVLTDLKLEANALGAQAAGKLNTASGDYSLAGLKLHLTSPAIAKLSSRVSDALSPVRSQLSSLDGRTGALSTAVSNLVKRINPTLNLLGADASVNANIDANVSDAVKPLLTGDYESKGVSVNLQTGDVTVDLAALLGGKINDEPVGTEVLSDTVVNQVLTGITDSISSLADQILAKVRAALLNAKVAVHATLDTTTPQAPIIGKKCTDPGDSSGDGGLIGGLVGGVVGGVTGLVCKTTTKLLPDLKTSLDVNVNGSVSQLLDGTSAHASATLKLLGVPVKVNVNGIVGGLGSTLQNHLFDSTSAVSSLTKSLHANLIDPAVTGLLGSDSSVEKALTDVVSVKLNNQDTTTDSTGKIFTETALRVAVLPTTGTTAATVNLAQASVGPNVTRVVPGTPSDPTCTGICTQPAHPSDPSCTGICTSHGQPSNPIASAALGNLAFTGVGIGYLISVILALLAAGAYLVREGYRRNSRRQTI